jgi:nucleoside-diphosphate-sugar epimerase
MQALVTGGGGFTGAAVVRQLLARGDRVRVFGRGDYPKLRAAGVECIQGDIRDAEAVRHACAEMDIVYHVAGMTGLGRSWRRFFEVNALGTQHVLDGCREHDVPRLVYTSSPSVVFDAEDQAGVDESTPYPRRWLTPYSYTKALGEQAVLQANGERGLATCALRPHLIWGPGDRQLVPRLWDRARQGKLRRVGDGRNLIDITYIDNAAEAHLLAADRLTSPDAAPAGRAYFISQGEPIRCWGWIDDLLAIGGMPPVQGAISFSVAWRLGWVMEKLWGLTGTNSDPPMTRFLAAQLAQDHYYDISAARRDLGYEPRVSIQEGMRRLADWLAENDVQ